ncbi:MULTISPECIES: N-6 DNA methylase [unclassified Rhizobium]|uniref:Eco57I restriction-modification methylase domain-containing protein n=1 Tax=unclassified Rhizobium TaxID=2613769 RepID=UPI000BE7FF89|nr:MULTISPECIES: N-6 DNA methylase [unclassified Rhizobium]MDF0660823.1 N-6 DNA methylase [Rhizobium sp. BC49]PDS85512.1 restriction endonuclease [Rhizobium sp. L18]
MARKTITDMSAWPSLSLEGNLIAPAMIAKIDQRQAPEQSPEDYSVRKGLQIREEIATAFRVGQSHFDAFAKIEHPSAAASTRFLSGFLKETFGYADLTAAPAPIALSASGRVPIVVVPPQEQLDRRSPTLSTDRSRSPAFALQDYLNDRDDALWGIVTNGMQLRLMRDNASLTRPAYIEADLAQMFTNEDIASFAVLWLLIQRSRFGAVDAPATDCALERWRDAGSKEGEAARDRLADQVQLALKLLGSGFLEANPDLAAKLHSGEVNLTEWFNELLRLVYRLILLMVAEDRNLLHPEKAKPEARNLYAEGYSLQSLRKQCYRATTWDKHHDRYEGVKVVFRALMHGQPALALPALGGLFAEDKLPQLETAKLRNRAFMEALYRLSWLADKNGMVPVNWRAMETEELGSVYESLLELQPQLGDDGKTLVFASEVAEQKGNQRKTTGSYYTPDSLVQALLDSALDPVLDKTQGEADDPAKALLKLSVIDPACGSGHFLLAAARRIATRLARIRAEGTPSLADFRHALRDVARCCIHGVDRNPMAVELTKVALWIETVDPGLPLGFFDAQIRCGDALLGVFDLKVLQDGIPDAAYKPLTGDDKDTAKYYVKANRDATSGQGGFDFGTGLATMPAIKPLALDFSGFRDLPEDSVEQIGAKAARFKELRKGETFVRAKTAADLYVSAFLLPKVGGAPAGASARTVPTTEELWMALNQGKMRQAMVDAPKAARSARAFHWPLEFPDVMQRGGFDVVLGNPPWDILQQDENSTSDLDDRLKEVFKSAPYDVLSGRRDLYKLFLCRLPDLLKPNGVSGLLVPVGYLVEEDCTGLRQRLWENGTIEKIAHFQNAKRAFFSRVHASYRFSIIEYKKVKRAEHWFSYTITDPTFILTQNLGVTLRGKVFNEYIQAGAFGELHKDLSGLKAHRNIISAAAFAPSLCFSLAAEWHATTHKSFAVPHNEPGAQPVGKNRDIHQFNDAFADASFFVSSQSAELRAQEKGVLLDELRSRILIRDIARNDDTVTLISCLTNSKLSSYDTPAVQISGLPRNSISRDTALLLIGYLNSRIADFIIRPFVDKHIKGYVLRRVPVPQLDTDGPAAQAVVQIAKQLNDLGMDAGNQVLWDVPRAKELLRNLDATVANWLGISQTDQEIVFREFPHLYKDAVFVDAPSAAARPIQLPPLGQFPDTVWAWPQGINERDRVRTQLRAMVGILPEPSDVRRVRLAALACLQPGVLDGFLSEADRREWQRLMAHSAGVTQLVPPTNAAWGAAFNELVSSAVLDVSTDGVRWGAGTRLDRSTLNANDPAIGRALFAWSRLEGVNLDQGLAQVSAVILPFIREGRLAA